ncbi:unnamed protein product [Porites lobata]|uniref:NACHT domain-containing protein n=1 Tax=Porites lobata TaxID=104759 RepID=A0ABN8RS25_9CNID|nr:unnamed protein product [Porites lobata]
MASSLWESESRDDRVDKTHRVRVTFLASEWGSSKGGLSTINRELAIQLAKCPEVEVSFFLPQCSQDDKKLALKHNVKIIEAAPLPGFEQLDWLCVPPEDLQIDIIIGHGAKLGKQAQIIKKSKGCKWVQVVHTDPEELGMFKNYSDAISKGEEKHKTEIKLCEMADHVVGVGPKLSEAFRSYLRSCQKDDNVVDFTPGVFEEFSAVKQAPSERQQRSVLVFGRGDIEDFKLKGFDIAGKAVAELEDTRLVFVGAPDGKHEEIANRLTECGVPASRLRVRGFLPDRESLKRLFQEVDLVVMPSRTEGFGLTGLEALSAGLPVLVSRNSGFGETLCSVPFGSSSVINTEDPSEWTSAIKKVWAKDRKNRLEEAETLRYSYDRKYNWAKQINDLIEKMISWIQDDSSNVASSSETTGRMFSSACKTSQRTEGMDEHRADLSARKQPSSSVANKEELPDSLCLEECQKQLRSIYETSSKVKIVPWDQSSAVHIDEIYTQLSWLMDEKKPSGVTQKELKHYTDIFDGGRLGHTPKRILVHGRPGIGKTVFTQKATFDWSQPRCKGKLGTFDLVLLVKLRDVCDLDDVPGILSAANLLASDGPISTDNLYDYVRRHQEKVLLILDGYDEYVHSAERQSPVLQIWEKKQLRDCCVIVTSRDMKGERLKSSSDAQFEIDGFDRRQQKEFARRFLKDDQDVEEFFRYLKQQSLEDVAKIPIVLLMLSLVWEKKDRVGLPSSRVMIYDQFIQTMFNHMSEKQNKPVEKVDDHKEELCKVGELAFDALLQDLLYFPLSILPDRVLTEKLIEAGLFQLLNVSALNPSKDVHFIHKSMQEFLASKFVKEDLLSQESKNNSLFKADSIEKIFKLNEVFKFVGEMSEEAARKILIHLLEMAAKEDGEYSFDNQAPSVEDLSETQKNLLTICTQLFFYCSADTRTELFPTFLSNLGGVLFILNPDQLNIAAKENFVKTTASLMYIFFSDSNQYTEQSYNNLISLAQQLNAVIVSRTGEQKASEFLNVFPWRSVDEFFLMKEENNTHLYFTKIVKRSYHGIRLPLKMVKTLVSLEETTKKTNMNGDESSEESSSSCCSKRHGLSRVRRIEADDVNRSEVEQLIEMMTFFTAPHVILVWGELYGEVFDAEVTESLLRSIPTTHKLERLILRAINLTSSPAVEFISRVFKQDLPNLKLLDMSWNPLLGAGVDSLIKHLSCAPHLEELILEDVKMTPQQVMNLTSAIKQHGNIIELWSDYHDNKGNPKPEHEWPSEDFWRILYPRLFPDSSPE